MYLNGGRLFPSFGGEGMITRWEMSLSIMVGSVGDVSYHCKGGGGGGGEVIPQCGMSLNIAREEGR